MNKCRIKLKYLREVHKIMKEKNPRDTKKNRGMLAFVKKWKLTSKDGKMFHDKKQVIPYEQTEAILKDEAMNGGMPLSRDGAMAYLGKKYIGFKRQRVMDWLKRVEQLQLIHRRSEVPRSKPARAKEGATNWRMSSANEGRFNLGVDLFDIPEEWGRNKFFFIAVLQRNGFTWIYPMTNKRAVTARTMLKRVFKDCKKRFGHEPTGVTSDKGGEFKGEFTRFLKGKKVKQKFEKKLVSWVEKKNSTLFRTFAVLFDIHGFNKATELALEKINNTVSRKTGKAAVDWTYDDFMAVQHRNNRKIKAVPKRKLPVPMNVDDRVRIMLKRAVDKGGMYKSYEGLRKRSHWMWSREIYKITQKKSYGPEFGYKYKINKIIDKKPDPDWYPARELQLIAGSLIRLAKPRPKLKPVPRPQPKGKMKRGFPPKPKAKKAAPGPRRSTRVRKAPKRFGFS